MDAIDKGTERPAVDVSPQRAHPVLAFALALLAVPGSTIAWELPAGGLWIGLPLAVAAIVLGTRARRHLGRSGLALAAVVIGSLAILQMAIWTVVSVLD